MVEMGTHGWKYCLQLYIRGSAHNRDIAAPVLTSQQVKLVVVLSPTAVLPILALNLYTFEKAG